MQAEAVFLRIDADGSQAEFVGSAKDANGDLAAVGGEQLLDGVELCHYRTRDAPREILYCATNAEEKRQAGGKMARNFGVKGISGRSRGLLSGILSDALGMSR